MYHNTCHFGHICGQTFVYEVFSFKSQVRTKERVLVILVALKKSR